MKLEVKISNPKRNIFSTDWCKQWVPVGLGKILSKMKWKLSSSSLGINYWDFFTYLDVNDMLIIFLLLWIYGG